MDSVVHKLDSKDESAILEQLARDLTLLSDLSRADVLLYARVSFHQLRVVAQARPHSIAPIHDDDWLGRQVAATDQPVLWRAVAAGRYARGERVVIPDANGAPLVQEVHPLRRQNGHVFGAVSIETNRFEAERQSRRRRPFRGALRRFQEMVLRGEAIGLDTLTPFGENDGILIVDASGRIEYASGVAANIYRRLGFIDSVEGKFLSDLETGDAVLVQRALEGNRCRQEEAQERDRLLVRKVIPLVPRPNWWERWRRTETKPSCALLLIHDETAARRRRSEQEHTAMVIKEIHHRIKNNLQSITSILRMQARRSTLPETRLALDLAMQRILTIADIHTYLAYSESQTINVKDTSQRIIQQIMESVADPEKRIEVTLEGPAIYLNAQQATAYALVFDELLLNALHHGYERKPGGHIRIGLEDTGDGVTLRIVDDGVGLPPGFDLDRSSSLGLTIVRTLVESDLRGHFDLHSDGSGVTAVVAFCKAPLGGGGTWNELD